MSLLPYCSTVTCPLFFLKTKEASVQFPLKRAQKILQGLANEVVSILQRSAFSSASSPVVLPCLKGGWEVVCNITATFILHIGGAWAGQTPARPCLPFLWLQLRHNTCSHLQERFKIRTSTGRQLYYVEASAMPCLSRLHDRAGLHQVYWTSQL